MKRRKFLVKLSLITGAADLINPFFLISQNEKEQDGKQSRWNQNYCRPTKDVFPKKEHERYLVEEQF